MSDGQIATAEQRQAEPGPDRYWLCPAGNIAELARRRLASPQRGATRSYPDDLASGRCFRGVAQADGPAPGR